MATLREKEFATDSNRLQWISNQDQELRRFVAQCREERVPDKPPSRNEADPIARQSVCSLIQSRKRLHDKDSKKIITLVDLTESDDERFEINENCEEIRVVYENIKDKKDRNVLGDYERITKDVAQFFESNTYQTVEVTLRKNSAAFTREEMEQIDERAHNKADADMATLQTHMKTNNRPIPDHMADTLFMINRLKETLKHQNKKKPPLRPKFGKTLQPVTEEGNGPGPSNDARFHRNIHDATREHERTRGRGERNWEGRPDNVRYVDYGGKGGYSRDQRGRNRGRPEMSRRPRNRHGFGMHFDDYSMRD